MPKKNQNEAELKSVQFPILTSPAWATFWVFRSGFSVFEMLWWFTVNHNRPGVRMRMGGLRNLSFCQWASAHVFLRSSHRAKNLVRFLYSRKHFHNFKYNNFLFGMMPGIIRMYSAFIYLVCSLDRKGLEEIRSRSSIVKRRTFCPLMLEYRANGWNTER